MRFAHSYHPLYFLSSLGMGGLSVTFFMYIMFLVPHPGSPIPSFAHLWPVVTGGAWGMRLMAIAAAAGILYFATRHVMLLVTSLRAHMAFRRTEGYSKLRTANGEVSLMAIPLTLAMTVNVMFIVAALFIPGVWEAREWLFPFALLAFTAIGALGLHVFGRYIVRILTHRNFDIDDTNHFSQVLPSFAFAMIGVGFSASAAMSHVMASSVLGMVGAFLFYTAAAAWIVVKLPVSFGSMLRHGMAIEAGPTLWLGIPIFTLVGIGFLRITAGISHNVLHTEIPAVLLFVVFGLLVAAQIAMGLFGWVVMRSQGYFKEFLHGSGRSIASYGLICPGVALSVLGMFFIHWGLVNNHIITRFSVTHLALVALVAVLQAVTIVTVARLNRKLLGTAPA